MFFGDNIANPSFEKSIYSYSQNLWITLWGILGYNPITWRGIRLFVTLPIFCIVIIMLINNMLP